jgi:hypothetical protein
MNGKGSNRKNDREIRDEKGGARGASFGLIGFGGCRKVSAK